MQKSKAFWVSISMCFMFIFGGALNAQEMSVGNDIGTIVLELDGASNIKIIESDKVIKITDLKYDNLKTNPIALIKKSDRIILKQKPKKRSEKISYTLAIPSDKKIKVSAGYVNLTGSLKAKSLSINSGSLNVDMKMSIAGKAEFNAGVGNFNIKFDKCGKIEISSGSSNGTIVVPKTTKIEVPLFGALHVITF